GTKFSRNYYFKFCIKFSCYDITNNHSFFFSSRRRHTRWPRDWSSDVCSSDLLAALTSCFQIHHLAAQTSVCQSERIEQRIYALDPDTIDQDIGCAVIADSHHHGGKIAQSNLRHTWSQAVHDGAVCYQIRGLNCVYVRRLQLALLSLPIEFRQDGDFD